jgi:hypothetical protein
MRLLVCGSRDWTLEAPIRARILALMPTVVIEGEARGADSLARKVAQELGILVEPYPADWARHGRTAGPIRSQEMLVKGKPDLVLAFSSHLETSRGTLDMVNRAKRAGVPVEVVTGKEET